MATLLNADMNSLGSKQLSESGCQKSSPTALEDPAQRQASLLVSISGDGQALLHMLCEQQMPRELAVASRQLPRIKSVAKPMDGEQLTEV